MTVRATPGSESDAFSVGWPWRIAWVAQNATNTEGRARTNVIAENTASFAQSTGRRFGTAVRLARIIPVEYSAVIVSTARTAIASWDRLTPAVAISSGWR